MLETKISSSLRRLSSSTMAEYSEGQLITTAPHLNPGLLWGRSTELMQLHSPSQMLQRETPFCRSAFHTQPNCFQPSQQSRASHSTVQTLHSASGFKGSVDTPRSSILTYYVKREKQGGLFLLLVPLRKQKHPPTVILTWGDEGILYH